MDEHDLAWQDFLSSRWFPRAVGEHTTTGAVSDDYLRDRVAGDTIGHVRTGSGNEVDLGPIHVPSPGGSRPTVPVEVKWVDANWRNEAKVIENEYGRGVLATKIAPRPDPSHVGRARSPRSAPAGLIPLLR